MMLTDMKISLKKVATRLPPIARLLDQRSTLAAALRNATRERDEAVLEAARSAAESDRAIKKIAALQTTLGEYEAKLVRFGEGPPWVPNGHFYSPIAPQEEIEKDADRIFAPWPRTLPGIDLREDEQLKFLEVVRGFYADLPFKAEKVEGLRYNYGNQAYSYSDGIILNSMLRYARPKRVIEVGSGHSSCMTLDTSEIWLDNSVECTFIEPYPDLLHSLLKPGDEERISILPTRVQDVDLSVFKALEADDVLFIDSTHVSRVGSDVNRLIFDVLPTLAKGVYVHVHDIVYPFEYFRGWIEAGRAWNEAYLLRAFLENNSDFEIVMFNTFMEHFHEDYFAKHLPLCLLNRGGSIWLRKKD
ncbi:class I SAM-dependent methyltransferase [Paraburkholderia sp. RL17-347-BIC-D]|uniref:class I SAM-dependent methyltransferase n=1 Tax=Paraburkholderia sp. RL17-347-BIC-D TaxID=3031632 RepID=UPI0038BB03F7